MAIAQRSVGGYRVEVDEFQGGALGVPTFSVFLGKVRKSDGKLSILHEDHSAGSDYIEAIRIASVIYDTLKAIV